MNFSFFYKIIVILISIISFSSCNETESKKQSSLDSNSTNNINQTQSKDQYSSDQISINHFEQNTPLKLVNNGNTNLAVRHHKGEGIPLVFIHGTLDDHSVWLSIASELSKTIPNPIVLLDLRGHSASKLTINEQGSIIQDADDIVKLVKKLGYSKAQFIGHSYGANITIKIANTYPEIASQIFLYEPPVFGLLFGKPEYKEVMNSSMQSIMKAQSLLKEGEIEEGIKLFIEKLAFGDNSWNDKLDEHKKSVMLTNFQTYIDQANDTERLNINVKKLNNYNGNITIIKGTKSLPHFSACINELEQILDNEKVISIDGAGHSGVFTHTNKMVTILTENIN